MRQLKLASFLAAAVAALLALPAQAAPAADHDHADRMAEEHQKDQPTPTPAASLEPARPVTGEEVAYATFDGKTIQGYLARPEKAEGNLPALIVIHEWWGLNDNVKAMTRRLAGEGYLALAVDLYEGEVAGDPQRAKALMDDSLTKLTRVMNNLRQAQKYLAEKRQAAKIGVIGWCYGGGWSLETAMNIPDGIDAAVMYYGRVVTETEELNKVKAPLLGLFGELDASLPVGTVKAFEAKLKELGKEATIVIYPGADHAFANPSGTKYNAAAAEDAWKRTTAHFAKHLR